MQLLPALKTPHVIVMHNASSHPKNILDEHTVALNPKTSQMVMDLTQKIVEDHQLTTLMIAHDMKHAIEYGNRLIMLYQGKIVVDVKGEEKKHLTVEDLMHLFQKNSGQSLVSDELVLG